MHRVAVGQASSGDHKAIRDLVDRAYRGYVPRIGKRPAPMTDDYRQRILDGEAHVAQIDGCIVGLIVLSPRDDYLHIGNIAVDPDRQREGIGTVLLGFAEERARELGLTELRLYTNAAMTENLDYYPKRGFTAVERRHEDGFDRVYFSRVL
ncbi:GNAT family N-acetyltransferase [Microbacterium resistens]|uniref:GNAT family N-acetyltransferase n=1 Tax=Microbacterium resistens TaxID=156977 RepID=UPI001C58D960|nr:GNAT family N-acetyltransferase [Microbacterium resistens]MBW1638916.1 GNAT family N-acetyltransferase [Microbacterium resistens]